MNDQGKRKAGEPHIVQVAPAVTGGQLSIAKFKAMLHVAISCHDWERICCLLYHETATELLSQCAVTPVSNLQQFMLSNIGNPACLKVIEAFCQRVTIHLAEAVDLSSLVLGAMLVVVDTERCHAMLRKRQCLLSAIEPLLKFQKPITCLRESQKEFQHLIGSSEVFDFKSCQKTLEAISHTGYSAACQILETGIQHGIRRVGSIAQQTTDRDLHCHVQYLEPVQQQIKDVYETMTSLDRVVMVNKRILDRFKFYSGVAETIDRQDGYERAVYIKDVLSLYEKATRLADGLHCKTVSKSHDGMRDSRMQQNLVKRIISVVQNSPERADDVSYCDTEFETTVLTRELVTALECCSECLKQNYKAECNHRIQLEQSKNRHPDYLKESEQVIEETLGCQDSLIAENDKLKEELRMNQETIKQLSEVLANAKQKFQQDKEKAQKTVTEMQNRVYNLQAEIRKLKEENSHLKGARLQRREGIAKQKATESQPGLNHDAKTHYSLPQEARELIKNPSRVEELLKKEQTLRTQVEIKAEAFRKQEIQLNVVKRQLDAMQLRLLFSLFAFGGYCTCCNLNFHYPLLVKVLLYE
jgi:hypothetical protein